MFSFTGNFVWFDLKTNEIIYDHSKINVKLYNRYVLLPELVPNESCNITFLHLGNYIDRGWESIQSLAFLKYINEIKGNLESHFLTGNHEISYNNDGGIDRFHNQLKNLNCLEASYILQKDDNKYICYSHCQLTKENLNIMFRMVRDLLGFGETRSENEFRDSQNIFQELINRNPN